MIFRLFIVAITAVAVLSPAALASLAEQGLTTS
jgi:hypothetical protein